MKTEIVHLKSISPYSQSRHYVVDKLSGEGAHDYEARTWRERIHSDEDGGVYIPPMAFKNCLDEAAKFMSVGVPGKGKATFTKHFEAGVLVTDALALPLKKDQVSGEWLFVPSDGIRGSGKRVEKCFPVIPHWSGKVTFYILDETILQTIDTPEGRMTAFEYHIRQAGKFIGLGRFRPRKGGFYGRFNVERIEWK